MSNEICKYVIPWVGKCGEKCAEGLDRCERHQEKCVSCGNPSTHGCDETGQFVCGGPLCDDCEHTIAEDGTNGGVGFYRTSPLPDGYKIHCKKGTQVYTPWYTRKDS